MVSNIVHVHPYLRRFPVWLYNIFQLGWFNNQLVMVFFGSFPNLLHQPPLRRRPPAHLGEVGSLGHLGGSSHESRDGERIGAPRRTAVGVGGGKGGGGIFNGSWSILHDFFGKGLAIEKETKEDVLDCLSEFGTLIFNKMLIEDVDLETQCHTKKWHQNPVDQILLFFFSRWLYHVLICFALPKCFDLTSIF